ncbi:MAG TPA: hypothetical protein VFD50_02690 [Thermoleophilia bacterium]|nr:hypothetical protein [Thermoleophilia bacterium]
MDEGQEREAGTARTVAGCMVILATAPAFMAVVHRFAGLAVIAAGLVALASLAFGVFLAGRWLGVFRGRRSGSVEQPGCLPLLMTLFTLLSVAIVLFYTVYYGAGAYLGGWNV